MLQKYNWYQKMTIFLLFLNSFMIPAQFREREFGGNEIDFQIILKLGTLCAGMACAIFLFRHWVGSLKRIDNIFSLLMLVWFLVASLYAPSIAYSLVAFFTLMCTLCLFFTASYVLGTEMVMRILIWGLSLVTIVSLVVYVVNPEFGRMKMWSGGVQVPGPRLTGITGTANAIGYITSLSMLLLVCYRLYFSKTFPTYYYGLFALSFGAQILSQSRSSFAAAFLAVLITVLLDKVSYNRLLLICCCGLSLISILIFVDLTDFLILLSRSGDIEEMTTGTGRTEIWSETIDMIAQRPVFGWGWASSGYYMPSFDHSSPHAHNMFLQIFFSTGIIGLFVVVLAFITKIYFSIKCGDRFKLTLLLFFLIHGLSEASAFHGVASIATIVFSLILATEYSSPERNSER